MTGIEVFANLVAAYEGPAAERSRKAFGSLIIIMGTTLVTMVIVGPAIFKLADSSNPNVSVFTQTMDSLLPFPLPYLGTLVGVIVLASAAAASAQGLQNLALGLRYRNYIPAFLGRKNHFEVADMPVWLEVGVASLCYVIFGTRDETYLTLYAAGVFVLLSMTGWAAVKRLTRYWRKDPSNKLFFAAVGASIAALLTTGASSIIFFERFSEGAWAYLLFIPGLYAAFGYVRSRLGAPAPLEDHLGRFFTGQYLLPLPASRRPGRDDQPGYRGCGAGWIRVGRARATDRRTAEQAPGFQDPADVRRFRRFPYESAAGVSQPRGAATRDPRRAGGSGRCFEQRRILRCLERFGPDSHHHRSGLYH